MKFLRLNYGLTWKVHPHFLNIKESFILKRKLSDHGIKIRTPYFGASRILGQPSSDTHPHLLKPNELVPGFSAKDFVERRERLVSNILKIKSDLLQVILVPSSPIHYMTEKIPYVFRQNTDFRYLTGCLEPDSALLIVIESENKYKSTLFLREKNRHSELWEGPRTGVEIAPDVFGVDDAKSFQELEKILKGIGNKNVTLWYDALNPVNTAVHRSVASFLSDTGQKELLEIRHKIHELRVVKSLAEQELMIKSAKIASDAIELTLKSTKPGLTEHQLFATVDYHCRMKGAEFLAYPPVVAAGENANIIHYISNTQQIKKEDLILMDAGCELHGYCSDITRTWPAGGSFSPIHRTLYDIVLSVQLDLISSCKEISCLDELFSVMCKLLGRRLKEAHVLSKAASNLSLEEVAFKLCPHHVGHYLGMDVHDTATIPRKAQLKEGMVITVEPGLYINSANILTKPEFRGIGIRIEDDLLFTNSGPKVISTCPKSVDEIESLCKR
uniref:Putative xaa-pro aminopeptidase n=2 Tax=Triatoma infestans TaxID=30076 RepID=A0A023F7N9_TRIIF